MSRRFLIPTILFALACMGAECSGSGGSSGAGASATNSSVSIAGEDEGGDRGASPVPEPGAALVFGAGLLAAGLVARRKRS